MSSSGVSTVRILHVDDDRDLRELTVSFLEREDDRFTVDTASNAAEGLEHLSGKSYDCIVSDYDMPKQDGIEFLHSVREEYPDLPFILYTGKGSEEVASEAISAGVTDYLQKESGTDQYTVLANRIANAVEHNRSQQLVERSERRLREIIDSIPQLLYVVDEDGTYRIANDTLAEFHDTGVEDIEGSHVTDVLHDPAAERFLEHLQTTLEAGHEKEFSEVELSTETGDNRIFAPRLLPYEFEESDKRAVLGVGTDITKRKRHERELEHIRERMQLALERTQSIIFEIDCDTGRVARHGAYTSFFDLAPDETPTWEDHIEQGVHPDDRRQFHQFYQQLIDGDRDEGTLEYRTHPDSGDVRWIRDTVSVEKDRDDKRQVVGIARDVTEHKHRELELRRNERRYQAIFDDPNILVGLIETDGSVVDINQTALEYVDASIEDVTGMPFWETPWFKYSDAMQQNVKKWVDRAANGEYVEFEADLTSDDDEFYTVEGVFRPVTNEDGDVVSIVVSDRDISERKEYERELEQTNAVLSTLFDTLPIGVVAADEDHDVVAINDQLVEMFDLARDPADIHGEDCLQLVKAASDTLENPGTFHTRIEEMAGGSEPVEGDELVVEDGRSFTWSYHPVQLPEGIGHLWVYRDITEHKTREARLTALSETTGELMAAETRDEVFDIAVKTAREVLGLNASALYLFDEEQKALVPAVYSDAAHDLIGEPPTLTADSIAWDVFQRREPLAVDNVNEYPDSHNPNSPIKSEVILPIDSKGVLLAGCAEPAALDDEHLALGDILANNIATALEQVEQTNQLRAREQELRRQNDRLEEFTSVVSHDLPEFTHD